jgi:hypothetical protein
MTRSLDQWTSDLDAAQRETFRSTVIRQSKGLKLKLDARAKLNATAGPNVRTGRLRSSIVSELEQGQDTLKVSLRAGGPTARYARIQEKGGVNTPKRGRYLTIPLHDAKTPAGDLKAEFAAGWRSVTGVFVLRAQSGQLYLARAEDNGLSLLARLVTSVRVPAQRYLQRAFETEVPLFKDRLIKAVKKLLGEGVES